jgi:hypothetical protein
VLWLRLAGQQGTVPLRPIDPVVPISRVWKVTPDDFEVTPPEPENVRFARLMMILPGGGLMVIVT